MCVRSLRRDMMLEKGFDSKGMNPADNQGGPAVVKSSRV